MSEHENTSLHSPRWHPETTAPYLSFLQHSEQTVDPYSTNIYEYSHLPFDQENQSHVISPLYSENVESLAPSQVSSSQAIATGENVTVPLSPVLHTLTPTNVISYPTSDIQDTSTNSSNTQGSSYYASHEMPTYYRSPIHEDVPRHPCEYPSESFHEIRPPEDKLTHSPPSSTSYCLPHPLPTSDLTLPCSEAQASHHSTSYCRSPTTSTGRRGRRPRKQNMHQLPYRRPYRQTEPRPYLRGGRSRRGRNHGSSRGSTQSASSSSSFIEPDVGSPDSPSTFSGTTFEEDRRRAYVQIIEQPQSKALRFRYICEGRSAGSIPGVSSTSASKTFPTIKIVNYRGPALVVVSCVTVDPPYRPHPHNLVGKEGCEDGICSVKIENDLMECSFVNLGIQCVKKRDVEKSLSKRKTKGIDPFNTGFSHRSQPQTIDLNAVRLCFQTFLTDRKSENHFPLKPVVSDPIYDKKATSDLTIYKLSDCSSCVTGRKEIILLCDKVAKEDIQVRFFEVVDGLIEWEAFGVFQASDVHKQVAIVFRTPQYKNLDVRESVKVSIQLYRPSDGSTSEPRPFEYYPFDTDQKYIREKITTLEDTHRHEPSIPVATSKRIRRVKREKIDRQSTSAISKSLRSYSGSRSFEEVKTEPLESYSMSPRPKQKRYRLRSSEVRIDEEGSQLPDSQSKNSFYNEQFASMIMSSTTPGDTTDRSPPDLHSPPTSSYSPEQFSSRIASSDLMGDAGFPPGPTAALASTSDDKSSYSESKSKNLLYHDMDTQKLSQNQEVLPDLGLSISRDLAFEDLSFTGSESLQSFSAPSMSLLREISKESMALSIPLNPLPSLNIPSSNVQIESEDITLSPNSESLKKLKLDIETLNRLSNR